ncbi:hypothetical protein BJ165DRAFT_1400665 [Panaeolus papilionaceus]|nr:hypothetical protein BJ165DRAFT_1400665 [Panaeolus papilionaceus]
MGEPAPLMDTRSQQQLSSSNDASLDNSRSTDPSSAFGSLSDRNPFLPASMVQRIVNGGASAQVGEFMSSGGASTSGGASGNGAGGGFNSFGASAAELGRATLMQMSEMSRRVGGQAQAQQQQSFQHYGGGPPADASQQQPQQQQQPLKRPTRAEALAQLRDLHNQRLATTRGWDNGATSGLGSLMNRQPLMGGGMPPPSRSMSMSGPDVATGGAPMRTQGQLEAEDQSRRRASEGMMAMYEQQQQGSYDQQQQRDAAVDGVASSSTPSTHSGTTPSPQNPWANLMSNPPRYLGGGLPSSEGPAGAASSFDEPEGVMTHEGLEVYTVGHLLPRSSLEDAQGNWTFDAGGLTLGGGAVLQGMEAQQQQQGASSSSTGEYGSYDNTNAENGDGDDEVVRPTPTNPGAEARPSSAATSSSSGVSGSISTPGTQKLRVRRSTFVPGWAVPPRVLLVDDDAVSRKLSSKFLKVFGCTTDVAVDGIGAVNKMNLEKYDLVLMDIVMPKLDGVSATSLIRKFDQGTPIISMTSNSKPNDLVTYYSSGMNDILSKPFTKEGLLDMLEKHLFHLKVIQQMTRNVPRSVGIPPLSDQGFEQAITAGAMQHQQALLTDRSSPSGSSPSSPPNANTNTNNTGALVPAGSSSGGGGLSGRNTPFNFNFSFGAPMDDEGRVNPLAGMGLTDEQYNMILQNLVSGDGFMGTGDGGASGSGAGMSMGGMDGMGGTSGPSGSRGAGGSSGMGMGMSEKRPHDDVDREGSMKRGRFEVVE